MSVTFVLPAALTPFARGTGRVRLDITPTTVGEALESLWAQHPGVRDRVVDERGEVRAHVNVFVGPEAIRWTGGLATAVPEGAEISIVPAVSGG